jgi:ribosomal protein S21
MPVSTKVAAKVVQGPIVRGKLRAFKTLVSKAKLIQQVRRHHPRRSHIAKGHARKRTGCVARPRRNAIRIQPALCVAYDRNRSRSLKPLDQVLKCARQKQLVFDDRGPPP